MAEAPQKTPVKSEERAIERAAAEWSPLANMRREFDRMPRGVSVGRLAPPACPRPVRHRAVLEGSPGLSYLPAVDIAEKEKEYEITAELPGMDESNIDVKFTDGVLTVEGEKKEEKEEKKKDYYLSERRYGSFQRSFPVAESVDAGKIEAKFVNGVLTIRLPKSPKERRIKKG